MVRQSEILRLRVVAFRDSAPVRSMRIAWRAFARRRRNEDGSSPSCTGRAYRDRGSRKPSLVTVGTSHIVEAGMVRRKTRRYKSTKSVLGDGGAVGFTAFFRGLSILDGRMPCGSLRSRDEVTRRTPGGFLCRETSR